MNGRYWSKSEIANLRHMYVTNVQVSKIAETLNRTYDSVGKKLSEEGFSNAREQMQLLDKALKRIAELEK